MSGEQDSEMMERPSLPSSGLAGMSTYSTQPQAADTPTRLSWAERFKKQAQQAEAKAMEGLSRQDDWDSPINYDPEPVEGSRSLPLRNGEAQMTDDSHMHQVQPSVLDENESLDGSADEDYQPTEKALPFIRLGRMDHVVLTPLVPTVRDIYDLQLKKGKPIIDHFLADTDHASTQTLNKVDKLIADLKLIGDHQDLLAGASDSQQNLSNDTMFKWAVNCSPKCLFLEKLFERLRSHPVNIAILARPGMMLDILTAILETQGISYRRPDSGKENFFESDLMVTLLPTGFSEGRFVVSPVDAVIAFDSSFFEGELYTNVLRMHAYDPNLVAPLIVLVTDQSAEHVELCLPKNMDPTERKAYLCNIICQRREVGINTKPRPEESGPMVADYLLKCKDSDSQEGPEWPLAQDLDMDNLNNLDGLLQEQSGSTTQPHSSHNSIPSERAVNKRAREIADEDNTKRMRMTPVEEHTSSEEVSLVPDSAAGGESSSVQAQSGSATHWTFAQVVADRAERDAKYAEETAGLHATIADLKAKLRVKNEAEARVTKLEADIRDKDELDSRLRAVLKGVEEKLAEHVALINKIQPIFQQATLERNKAVRELSESEDRAAALSKRLEARSNELNEAKLTINKTQEELKETRSHLILSTVPEIRELQELKNQLQAAEEEKVKAQKRYDNLQKDFEFTKEQYQKASNSAGAFSKECDALREQNKRLQLKADANRVDIQKIQADSVHEQLDGRIEELKGEVADLKGQLLRKAEELKKRGDRSLRGVSAPGSPMVGQFAGYGRSSIGK